MLKIVMRLAFAALFLSATSLAYKHFQASSDPLAKGVPPRTNADGTVDYTMLSKQFSNSDNPGQIQEWVVRLDPKYISGTYGNEDMSVTGGGVSFQSKGQPNLGYYAWFRIADLTPVSSFERGKGFAPKEPHSFLVLLEAEKYRAATVDDVDVNSIKFGYHIVGTQEFGLEPYTGNDAPDNKYTRYVLWREDRPNSIKALLHCRNINPSCDVTFFWNNGRRITGHFAQEDRDKLAELAPRFEKFMQEHTQVDRTYPGTPFVYGGDK